MRLMNRRRNEEDKDMKVIFVIAAALGLSATSAMAWSTDGECTYNQASAASDRQETTGSIDSSAKQDQAFLIKKDDASSKE